MSARPRVVPKLGPPRDCAPNLAIVYKGALSDLVDAVSGLRAIVPDGDYERRAAQGDRAARRAVAILRRADALLVHWLRWQDLRFRGNVRRRVRP